MTAMIASFDLPPIPDRPPAGGRPGCHPGPPGSPGPVHPLSGIGDGQGPEDAADFARDPTVWLRRLGILEDCIPGTQTLRRLRWDRDTDLLAELQSLVVRLVWRLEACAVDGKTVRASFDADRGVPRTHIVLARLDRGLVDTRPRCPRKATN